jgi:hypothetical protein
LVPALGKINGTRTIPAAPDMRGTSVLVTLLLYPALQLVISSGSPIMLVVTAACLMSLHAVRTSGLAIAYALGVTIFGGTAQIVFTWIIGATGDKLSWIWYIIAMSVISVLATWALRVPNLERTPQMAAAHT